MSYLQTNDPEYISTKITNKGRQRIAEGNFNIKYFQIGDSEFDYKFSEFNGSNNPSQKVFLPLDNDSIVKYPYKLYSGTTDIETTYGVPIPWPQITPIKNNMGAAGFVSEYQETGTTIVCNSEEIDITQIDGSNQITISTEDIFNTCEFLTIIFTGLTGSEGVIPNNVNSLVYKIVNISGSTITLDREMPNLNDGNFTGKATIICNKCNPYYPDGYPTEDECEAFVQDYSGQQDPWTLNIVWSEKPAGLQPENEELTGYTSNIFVSSNEFLGYNMSKGQLLNTGTTITNSYGEEILVEPEDQHSIAIIHYSEINNVFEPEKFFKYDDYISHDDEDVEYFEVYIPFILYHRNTGSTIGARFFMDNTDYFIDSSAGDTRLHKIKFRYLIDEYGHKVGKVFVGKRIIVFDDQEIVAVLEYKSNRKYTLPIPRVKQIPFDVNYNQSDIPLMMGGESGHTETFYLSYLFEYSGTTMNGLHCNHYCKVTGTTLEADVSFKFESGSFNYLQTGYTEYTGGYIANKFKVLVQKVFDDGSTNPFRNRPDPDNWGVIDFTDKISGHTVGDLINPSLIENVRFVISNDLFEEAEPYVLEDQLGTLPEIISDEPQFGDTQPFPGSIKLTRATDIHTLRFYVNLPIGEFERTQNPTYITNKNKVITEVALLDENKEVLIIGKFPKPLTRIGQQTLVVKLDF